MWRDVLTLCPARKVGVPNTVFWATFLWKRTRLGEWALPQWGSTTTSSKSRSLNWVPDGGCWVTTTNLLPRAFHFFSVRQILFSDIFNYIQSRIAKIALGEMLPYGTLTAAFLYSPSGVFNNLRSPNFVPGLDDNENAMECDCNPTCTDVSYSTEISESNFFKSEYDQTNFLWAKSLASIETNFIWYWTLYNFIFRVFFTVTIKFWRHRDLFYTGSLFNLITIVCHFPPQLRRACGLSEDRAALML